MANPNALMTAAEAAEYLGAGSSDFKIEDRIDALSTSFESRTGMILKKRTFTDYRVDGSGCYVMRVPLLPVQSVSKIEMRYDWDDSVYQTITSTTEFILKNKRTGYLQLINMPFLCGNQNVLLTMQCGFDEADSEFAQDLAEILGLFKRQLQSDWQLYSAREEGISSKSYVDGSITYFPRRELLPDVEFGLDRIRLRRF